METRDRLIELIKIAKKNTKGASCDLERNMLLAESLLANGVIVPPCKVGDTVYFRHIIGTNEDSTPIEKVRAGTIHKIQIEKDNQIWLGVSFGIWYCCRPYTDFYFSREEAEAKLKELKHNG